MSVSCRAYARVSLVCRSCGDLGVVVTVAVAGVVGVAVVAVYDDTFSCTIICFHFKSSVTVWLAIIGK